LCVGCGACEGDFRCIDCIGSSPCCQSCLLGSHRSLPLHIVEKWDGHRFIRTSLRSLGLKYQLGHPPGKFCNYPVPGHVNFHVINTNAIHKVSIVYCGCKNAPLHHEQLLKVGLWPATG
ncbi:hypothetical protein GYMLUDRAFT_183319, partial [Collybiopsis luxurians FD-317 M1]